MFEYFVSFLCDVHSWVPLLLFCILDLFSPLESSNSDWQEQRQWQGPLFISHLQIFPKPSFNVMAPHHNTCEELSVPSVYNHKPEVSQ